MRKVFWLVLCCWILAGCVSEESRSRPTGAGLLVRHALEREGSEIPAVFLPAALLEWSEWSDEYLASAGRAIYFMEVEPAGEVEEVMARRPLRRRGRGGPGGHSTAPLLNPRPTREEIAARRRQVE